MFSCVKDETILRKEIDDDQQANTNSQAELWKGRFSQARRLDYLLRSCE